MSDLVNMLWGPLGGVLAAVLAVLGVWINTALGRRQARREGAAEQRAKDDKETIERVKRGQASVQRGRDSGDIPDERLRRNDGRW